MLVPFGPFIFIARKAPLGSPAIEYGEEEVREEAAKETLSQGNTEIDDANGREEEEEEEEEGGTCADSRVPLPSESADFKRDGEIGGTADDENAEEEEAAEDSPNPNGLLSRDPRAKGRPTRVADESVGCCSE